MACDRETSTWTSHARKCDAARVCASVFVRTRAHASYGNLKVSVLQLRWWGRGAGSRFPELESAERISTGASGLVPGQGESTRRRTMMVMRDEMNCPTAEIINKMSDQNLQGICASGNG